MPFGPDFTDTDPRALEVYLRLLREMPVRQKVDSVFQLNAMLFNLAEAEVRRLHPEADEREVLARVAARHLDPETVKRVYGWDPQLDATARNRL